MYACCGVCQFPPMFTSNGGFFTNQKPANLVEVVVFAVVFVDGVVNVNVTYEFIRLF